VSSPRNQQHGAQVIVIIARSSDHALSRVAAAAKRCQHLGGDAFRVEARARIEFLRLVMIEKTVRKHHRPELEAARAYAVEYAILGERR
jgi:hypothetical protein